MVKMRMTTADVAAEIRCLKKLIGMRCANIYDISAKTYVIKFAKSSGVTESGDSEKALLLLESGVRLHTTQFSRDKSATPSGFTLKLRKHIRTRRLEDVRQLGIDRVVDFQFGLGETAHHIILELHSKGNFLLTDAEYNVLTLLRVHRDEEKGITMMTHHQYPVNQCRLLLRTTKEKLDLILRDLGASKVDTVKKETGAVVVLGEAVKEDKLSEKRAVKVSQGGQANSGVGKRSSGGLTLKAILGEGLGYGPVLVEHIILDAGLEPNRIVSSGSQSAIMASTIIEEERESLLTAAKKFEDWLESVVFGDYVPEGFIFMQKQNGGKLQPGSQDHPSKIYDEFSPILLNQFMGRDSIKFETFDAAMDEFFSKIEGQRAEQQRRVQEESAVSKLDKIRADQTNRVKALKQEVDQSVKMGELIEYNLADVDAAILAVRAALASGMDWKDLARMVKEEKKAGNPVAGLIHSLHLETNQITLLLSNNLDDMDDEEKTQPVNKVDVDIALSAHANACRWFETKKRHATKQEKTVAAHEKAFKAAEKRTQLQLAQAKSVAAISHLRKVHWFEKFNWFISSENFLVISGRDAQQNELVVKRHLKKGDLYVHADLHGASTTVIKNQDPTQLVPPLTINQAGSFTVCRSQAWDSKIVTSAWWVEAHQVSKTAPTGEYLTVGSFMIRGKKNFLPPNPLVMGFGFLFRLEESSIADHLNERRVRGEGEEDNSSVAPDGGHYGESEQSTKTNQEEDGYASSEDQDRHDDDIKTGTKESMEGAGSTSLMSLREVAVDGNIIAEINKSSELDSLLDSALTLPIPNQKKYGLEEHHGTSIGNAILGGNLHMVVMESKPIQREKPYVSKAERRKLKRGGSLGSNVPGSGEDQADTALETVTEEFEETGLANIDPEEASKAEMSLESSVSGKVGRGRKGKLKKMKEKYADQDEEERLLRMELLASAGRKDIKPSGKDKIKVAVKEDIIRSEDVATKICYKCKRTGHIARDCLGEPIDQRQQKIESGSEKSSATASESVSNLGANDAQQPKLENKVEGAMSRRAHAKAAKMEIANILAEENVTELHDDEKQRLTELDSLTGNPLEKDVLLYAVPVCGPYNSLQGYKFRVKLTPGAAKKGKAAKTAVEFFTHTQDVTAREKELMKAVTDAELVASMIGNVKVTAPGLTKLKQTQKKFKKNSQQDTVSDMP